MDGRKEEKRLDLVISLIEIETKFKIATSFLATGVLCFYYFT